MKCYVICCNDYPKFVVIGTEKQAEQKKLELEKEDFKKHTVPNCDPSCGFSSMEEFRCSIFWHLCEVECVNLKRVDMAEKVMAAFKDTRRNVNMKEWGAAV